MTARTDTLTNGKTAPVLRVESGAVTLNGEPLPLLVADEEIETRVDARSGAVIVRLSFITWGPVIIDNRHDDERSTVVQVVTHDGDVLREDQAPARDVDHALENGDG